jgi:Flp pilus assembly protein TadD
LDLDLLDEISKIFPENASHKNNKAYSLLQTSTSESVLKEAREILLKALRLSPKNIYVLMNLLYISDLKKLESDFHNERL